MKPSRCLFNNSVLALLSALTLSCIDNDYDIKNLSKEAEIFHNSLSAPIGTATIRLDSVLGSIDIDTSILSVKNGMYVFSYSGNFDLDAISNTLNGFTLASMNNFENSVNLFDASLLPSNPPYNLPVMDVTYSSTVNIDLPSFSTSLIDVDSILLTNTIIRMSTSSYALGGSKLKESITITFTTQGNGADYYINGDKKTSWTVGLGDTILVEIRKLRISGGNSTLGFTPSVRMKVDNRGDVQATAKVQTKMNFKMEYPNGIDFDLIWGRVNYGMEGNLNPINFDALGTILSDNDVLSIYNPTITLNTAGNLGVPVKLDLNMGTANSATGLTRNLSDAHFLIEPAASPNVTKENTFVLNKDNGTAELFKINPDQILMGYKVQTDTNSIANHFISKNSQLGMSYKMEIPLQFGGDLRINLGTTLKNPFADKLDALKDQENLSVAILLNIRNRIPLALQIGLTALDADSLPLFEVKTGTIEAGGPIDVDGFATGYTLTSTEISLTPAQINLIKDTNKFRVSFIVTAKQDETFVTIQPTDDIVIKIGGKINGGILLDFSSNSN